MKNIIGMEDFIFENQTNANDYKIATDLITGENLWVVFGYYLKTLENLTPSEKAVASDLSSQILADGSLEEWEEGEDEADALDSLISNVWQQVFDGTVTKEEYGFDESDYVDFLKKFIHIPGTVNESGIYRLPTKEFIEMVGERNPAFIKKCFGTEDLVSGIKSNIEKGTIMNYGKVLPIVNSWFPGSMESITATTEPGKLNILTKAYKLMQRK